MEGGCCFLTTLPVTQRLFWLLRVVTSLLIGAVILGECPPLLLGQRPLFSFPHEFPASYWLPDLAQRVAAWMHLYTCQDIFILGIMIAGGRSLGQEWR